MTPIQVLFCEYYEIFKKIFFTDDFWANTSASVANVKRDWKQLPSTLICQPPTPTKRIEHTKVFGTIEKKEEQGQKLKVCNFSG